MIIENRDDYINYRFKRAEDAFEDALILIKNKKWNSAINRLYYSSFYAVSALLLKHNINPQTHEGTRSQFSLNFIKNGTIEVRHGKFYSKISDYRQKGDYGDLYDYDEDTVSPLVGEVQDFLQELKKHILENT